MVERPPNAVDDDHQKPLPAETAVGSSQTEELMTTTEEAEPIASKTTSTSTKPRKWLVDRCDGNERVMNPNSKPCCAIFYAPLLLKFFPDYLEQNKVMECLGKTGLVSAKNITARRVIMILALLSTILGWSFLIVSDFAISTRYEFLEAAQFNYASISFFSNNSTGNYRNATRISLGLRAAAVSTFSRRADENYFDREEDQRVIMFDDFCKGQHQDTATRAQTIASKIVFVDPDKCHKCADASTAMVSSILMSTVTYFFTFTTDILRIWPNYDVNCQKVFGAFFAIFSAIMGVRTWFLYQNQCYASFSTGWTCFDASFNVVECGRQYFDDSWPPHYDNPNVQYFTYTGWQIGAGMICLGVATFAKVLDLVCNFIIPTPSITRNRDEQWEYEEKIALLEEKEADEEGKADEENNQMEKGNDPKEEATTKKNDAEV